MGDVTPELLNWKGDTGVILHGKIIARTYWPFDEGNAMENKVILALGVLNSMKLHPEIFFSGVELPRRKYTWRERILILIRGGL